MSDATVAPADAHDPLVLALDIGSSSVRALIFDGQARAVDGWVARRHYGLRTTSEGAAEANADELTGYVVACIDEVLAQAKPRGAHVAAVACDTFWHSLMGVGADGKPTTPVLTWADTRSVACAEQLRQSLDADAVHARDGAGLYANYLPAKLLWLSHADEQAFRATRWWMSFGEYLYFVLCGERRVSHSMASGTGMFDLRACRWDEEVIEQLPIELESLSPIGPYSEPCGDLRRGYAGRWPALGGTPWYLPLGDGACNNVGSGGVSVQQAVVMVGTSGAIRVVRETDRFHVPPGLWTYRVDDRRIVQGGAMSAGGNVFAWLAETLRSADPDHLERALEAVGPDSHGLTVLPFLAGERSPGWLADARAALVGMTLATSPAEIARATLEAVAYRFGLVFSLLCRENPEVRSIIGSGAGLLHSPAWTGIMTDVLGRPMTLSSVEEATCRGAALLALEALGTIHDVTDLPAPLGATVEPSAEHTKLYAEATRRQQALYDLLYAAKDPFIR